MSAEATFRPAAVIPCYNHGKTLRAVLEGLASLGIPVLVVDDGSDAENRALIDAAAEGLPFARVLHQPENGGKGVAVTAGVTALEREGFTHVLQVDADGQHRLEDAARLLETARQNPEKLVSGRPVYDESVPAGRKYGRLITQFWVALETLSFSIRDSMCGFRVYPAKPFAELVSKKQLGQRMDFDIEILVRLYWEGVGMIFVPTRVVYPEGGLSHFDCVRDNIRISKMHARLCLEAPLHWLSCLRNSSAGEAAAPASAREGWAAEKERGGARGIAALLWLYRRLGRKAFAAALYPVIFFYWATGRRAREQSRAYLARVIARARETGLSEIWPERPGSFRHFLHFGFAMLDRIAAWQGDFSISRDVAFEGDSERILSPAAGSRGKLLLTSHWGVAEVCRALAEGERSVPVTVLLFEGNAKQFRGMLEKHAADSRVDVVAVESIGIETAVLLSERIEAGGWVAIAADRTPPARGRGAVRVVWADFLGAKAPFPLGPWVLASLLECEVCTLFAAREGGRFRVRCDKLADRVTLPRRGREEAAAKLAAEFARRLEREVMRQPLEWFNFYDFWSDPNASQQERAAKNGLQGK